MYTEGSPPPRSAYQRRLCGFNLIEAAIVLAIVGVVIGTIWVAMAAVNYKLTKLEFTKGFSQIRTTAQDLLGQNMPCDTRIFRSPWLTGTIPSLQNVVWPDNWTEKMFQTLSGRTYVDVNGYVRCTNDGGRIFVLHWGELSYQKCMDFKRELRTGEDSGLVGGVYLGCVSAGLGQNLNFSLPNKN